jgi:hydroxymethylglutaryl-CoA lyase
MTETNTIILTETARDAMQGLPEYIHTGLKARYINTLLKAGFHTLDCGSFVSPKAVPQMADTAEVIKLIDLNNTSSQIMVLVGNKRGGIIAASESKVHTIAYPYSVSATFLKKNLNTTKVEAWQTILELKEICIQAGKQLRVYLAMAFGNPYGDSANDNSVLKEVERLCAAGIYDQVFSDITGEGTPASIGKLCAEIVTFNPLIQSGIHLHSKPDKWEPKVEAAWNSGIRRFESAVGGFGGCPMTGYELLGNLDTLKLLNWCKKRGIETGIDSDSLAEAEILAGKIFK